jgi:hypothetical protein
VVRVLLQAGADRQAINAEGRTALQVAACPASKCKRLEDLRRCEALLDGSEPLGGAEDQGAGASKGLFRATSQGLTLSGPGGKAGGAAGGAAAAGGKARMAGPEEGKEPGGGKEEDVYEFKTSSKEATPASSRGSASPGSKEEAGKEAGGEAGKRGKEEDGVEEAGEDGKQRKKRKEEGGAGRGRGVRGASTEKTVGKAGGARGRGAASADRKSPPAGRSLEPPGPGAPSPGKGKAGKAEAAASTPPALAPPPAGGEETDSDGDKSGKGEVGPKVPPLKIVLNSGTSNGREEDKNSKKNYIVNNGSEDGESSEGKTEGAESSTGDAPGRAERVTRSTRQQGGEEEEAGGSEQAREEQARQDNEYHIKKRKLRGGPSAEEAGAAGASGIIRQEGQPLTDIEKHLNIRKQIEQRRKNLFPVQPKPPQGFKDYLMNKKTYHLQGNTGKDSRIQPIPKIAPPPSLEGPLRELFLSQENARYKLRMNHLVEKEKLVLSVEQEILRVHGRAARALANQPLPYSVCTFMRDENVYTPIDPCQEEKNRDIRSRYNGRLFLSWLQDVDDKWEKIKVSSRPYY